MSKNTALFALVKWLSGEDKNKFTAGVPIDWIRDFKCKTFKNDGYPSDHSFIAEWRVGKKPAGGWPVYDVLVVEISERVSVLEKRIHMMSLSRSPKQVSDSSSGSVRVRTSPRKNSQAKSSLFNVAKKTTSSPVKKKKTQSTIFAQPKTEEEKKEKTSQGRVSLGREISGLDVLPPESESAAPADVMTFSRSDFNDFKLELMNEVKKCLTPLSRRLETVEKSLNERPTPEPPRHSTMDPSSPSVGASEETEKVRVGTGSKVAVMLKEAFDAALSSPTPSSMTKSLLVASFPLSVLLKSTYKGGKTKVGENKGRESSALDANVLAALKDVVTKKFPNFSGAQFGTAINQKITSLKSKYKESAESARDAASEEKTLEDDQKKDEEKPSSAALQENEDLSETNENLSETYEELSETETKAGGHASSGFERDSDEDTE